MYVIGEIRFEFIGNRLSENDRKSDHVDPEKLCICNRIGPPTQYLSRFNWNIS